MPSLWVPLDANYGDNDKILQAGFKAELLYIRSLAAVKGLETDGTFTTRQARRFAPEEFLPDLDELTDTLCRVGLWERNGDELTIIGWLDRNESMAKIRERSERESASGVLGNHRRWHTDRADPNCAHCTQRDKTTRSDRVASGTRSGTRIGGESQEIDIERDLLISPTEIDAVSNEATPSPTEAPPKPKKPKREISEPVRAIQGAIVDALNLPARRTGQANRELLDAAESIAEAGGTPDQVPVVVAHFRASWSEGFVVTPRAIARNWMTGVQAIVATTPVHPAEDGPHELTPEEIAANRAYEADKLYFLIERGHALTPEELAQARELGVEVPEDVEVAL
ncbi:MAG: hypothetical protein M0Z92_14130 [Actinomycetota bacterium]|nr:hypothetical protein [Actinomycetota bacterium]